MTYVVLGMHKSGTTLLAETLHKSGIDMVDQVPECDDYDFGAKYERRETLELNHRLLGWELNRNSLAIAGYPIVESSRKVIEDMRAVSARRNGADEWGFKDPRTCLTYDVWRRVLPQHQLLAIFRDPYQVCRHYEATTPWETWKVLHVWSIYNRAVLRACRAHPPSDVLALEYERFMETDDELARLESFLSQSVKDVRQPEKYRHRAAGGRGRRIAEYVLSVTDDCRAEELHEALAGLRK